MHVKFPKIEEAPDLSAMKKFLMVLVILLVFASVIAGLVWQWNHYVMVDFKFYPKNAEFLDLRGEELTVRQYERISRHLPGCRVLWDVPLSSGRWDNDAEEITLASLEEDDLRLLKYLPQLKTVQAEGCSDYALLQALQAQWPEVQVRYSVTIGGTSYAQNAANVDVEDLPAEEISLLAYLPELETVVCSGGTEASILQLQEYCRERGLEFGINIGGEVLRSADKTFSASGAAEEELTLLQFAEGLEQIHLEAPEASAESLLQLQEALPNAKITWSRELFDKVWESDITELDLSQNKVTDLDALEEELAYFPQLETVFLGKSTLDNETLAKHRDQVRDQYKLVWTVTMGKKLTARTDDTTFMPTRERVYYFNDEEAYNLRYCEDMVCIDIGHMSISNIEFVKFMPNLEYLILAHTQLQYIDPISTCKKLKFLELDWAPLKDLSPLLGCTALEDLNLGNTFADFEPIGKMTWLKNLWMIDCSRGPAYRMTQALTETKVVVSGTATVASGWRNLENYYKMRDLLGMEYMSW